MDAEGKLVRDRIPEIIEAAGGQPSTRVLDKAERLPAMLAKYDYISEDTLAYFKPRPTQASDSVFCRPS